MASYLSLYFSHNNFWNKFTKKKQYKRELEEYLLFYLRAYGDIFPEKEKISSTVINV